MVATAGNILALNRTACPGRRPRDEYGMQPSERIITQLRLPCTRHRYKPVLRVIDIIGAAAAAAFLRQIAIGIMGERGGAAVRR
jgi:hypothetical protein